MWKNFACRSRPVERKREESSKTLPDELVEKIIAMMPFPFIFKARGLSKSWLARFSSIGSLDDEEGKDLAISFQKQVRQRSKNWGPFFPVFIGKESSCAYNWAAKKWARLPSFPFLPKEDLEDLGAMSNLCQNGALLWSLDLQARILYVANIFTRSWKALPPPSNLKEIVYCNPVLVSDASLETYKLILFYEDGLLEELEHWSAQMYDSKSNAWSSSNLVEDIPLIGSPVYLNGVLYMVASFDLRNLLAINLEDGTSEELKLASQLEIEIETVDLVLCNGKLLMLVNDLDSPETLRVLQVDLECLELLEVSKGPPATLDTESFNTRHPVCYGDSIFFGMQKFGRSKLVYNVYKNEWSVFHFSIRQPLGYKRDDDYRAVSFQPGLNPFLSI